MIFKKNTYIAFLYKVLGGVFISILFILLLLFFINITIQDKIDRYDKLFTTKKEILGVVENEVSSCLNKEDKKYNFLNVKACSVGQLYFNQNFYDRYISIDDLLSKIEKGGNGYEQLLFYIYKIIKETGDSGQKNSISNKTLDDELKKIDTFINNSGDGNTAK